MQSLIIRESDKFPDPQFSDIQRRVFAPLQRESQELCNVLSAERETREALATEPNVSHTPLLRLGAYLREELIGWSLGWPERGDTFYMANSGVLPEFQRQGVYTALLSAFLAVAQERGAVAVRSQHSVLNNSIIICKLSQGFHISGLSMSAQMGTLVELTRHLSTARSALFESRIIPFVAARNDA